MMKKLQLWQAILLRCSKVLCLGSAGRKPVEGSGLNPDQKWRKNYVNK
jgi:hypothetical protein